MIEIKSHLIKDEFYANALHKLNTSLAWVHDPIYPEFVRQMSAENKALIRAMESRGLPRKAIELGSGTARQSRLLNSAGVETCAIELSPAMLRIAKEKSRSVNNQLGDARDFTSSEEVGAVIMGPNVSCYFLRNRDVQRTIECAANALATHGLFLIDFLPAKTFLRTPDTRFSRQFFKIRNGTVTRFNESILNLTRCVTWEWNSTYIFQLEDHVSTVTDSTVLRAFFPDEMESLLANSGFKIVKTFGYAADDDKGGELHELAAEGEYSSIITIAEAE